MGSDIEWGMEHTHIGFPTKQWKSMEICTRHLRTLSELSPPPCQALYNPVATCDSDREVGRAKLGIES